MKLTKTQLKEMIREELQSFKSKKSDMRLNSIVESWILDEDGDTILNPETGRKIKVSTALSYPPEHAAHKAVKKVQSKKTTNDNPNPKGYTDDESFHADMEKFGAAIRAGKKISPKKIEKVKDFLKNKVENVIKPKWREYIAAAETNEKNIADTFKKAGLKIFGQDVGYDGVVNYANKQNPRNPNLVINAILKNVSDGLSTEDRQSFAKELEGYQENKRGMREMKKLRDEMDDYDYELDKMTRNRR